MFFDKGINIGEWEAIALSSLYFIMSSLGNANILLQPHFLLDLSHASTWENASCITVQEIRKGGTWLPEVVSQFYLSSLVKQIPHSVWEHHLVFGDSGPGNMI